MPQLILNFELLNLIDCLGLILVKTATRRESGDVHNKLVHLSEMGAVREAVFEATGE